MRFKDTFKQKYKRDEYPQVRKTGVDARAKYNKDLPRLVATFKKNCRTLLRLSVFGKTRLGEDRLPDQG